MTLRSWVLLTALFHFQMTYQRIPIDQICSNLVAFYDIIYPLKEIKIALSFEKNSKYQYHTGEGNILFSPNIYINNCTSRRVRDINSVKATFTATLTIRFPKRSWVVIEECVIMARLLVRPTLKMSGERSVKISWIRVNKFASASANCGYGQISQNELKPILNAALREYTSKPLIFYVEKDSKPISFRLTSFMEVAFKHYMSRLVV